MSPAPKSSSRWCPTPEQLVILQELYGRGLTNPNASQIQKITARLSFYGQIQGKSVFYWFQNHKARDRQKLRKKLIAHQLALQQHLLLGRLHYQQHNLSAFTHHLSSSCCTLPNLYPQGGGGCEEAPAVMMKMADHHLPKDCVMRMYGNDVTTMIMEVGPNFACCRNRRLETLELFPLRSPAVKDQER